MKVVVEWRRETYDSDPTHVLYEIEDILQEDGIGLIVKIPPSRLYRDGPEAIVRELGETLEWRSLYARALFEEIWKHDHGHTDQVPVYE